MTTSIFKSLNIKYPIIQAPMLGVTTPEMVAAVAETGGLGSLPVGGLSPEKTLELIRTTKSKTDKPFSVNLFAHDTSVKVSDDELNLMQDFLEQVCQTNKIPFSRRESKDFTFFHYREQLDILISEKIPVVSFTFGVLKSEEIIRLKENGTVVIGTATCVEEARILESAGVDYIVAQGIEAGGHRGSFLSENTLPEVGLMSLLPQISDAVHVPVIAAGGLFDGRTMKAAFALGAALVQLGSVFITADESAATNAYKDTVLNASDTATELTRAFSGRWARGVKNAFMEQVKNSGVIIPYYTYQNSLTAPIRAYAQANDLKDFMSLWAGQSAFRSKRGKTGEIMMDLVRSLEK